MPRTANGTFFEELGNARRPTVLLIHGLGLCAALWQHQARALAQDYHVITYDLFGHGQSRPATKTPSLQVFSDQISELLKHCNVSKTAVVGFSLGGMIARKFAQLHASQVVALVILHSPHKRSSDAQSAILDRVRQAKLDGPASTVTAALERWFTKEFLDTHSADTALVRRWVLQNDPAIYYQNYRVLAEGVDEVVAPDPAIAAPTLVMTADQDFGNSPEMTRAIAAEIKGAETLVLTGLRHMALMEAPNKTTVPIINFLQKHLR